MTALLWRRILNSRLRIINFLVGRMGMDRDQHFADETRTGKIVRDLRGIGSVVIVARFPGNADLDWLQQLSQDLRIQGELKSEVVLDTCRAQWRQWDWLLEKLSVTTIAIVDVAEHIRGLFEELAKTFGDDVTAQATAHSFLRSRKIPQEYITRILCFLRKRAIHDSAVESIAGIVRAAVRKSGLAAHLDDVLPDHRILLEMPEREFREFAARFAIAFGDALYPVLQAEVIEKEMMGRRFFNEGMISLRIIERAIAPNFLFDEGSEKAFRRLKEAHQNICDIVKRAMLSVQRIGPGSVSQEDSKKVRGLQAADIAAGLAREIFESNYPDVQDASGAVRSTFARVLLNTRWLS